ncbi:MAG: antibiotic biosynthesis monooxygenase [Acidimicrobiia bacterium]
MMELEPDRAYVVFASSIPPISRRSTWRLFRGAGAVRRQLGDTDGVVGFSLLARPLRKQYATLSIWVDNEALAAFAALERPHSDLMKQLAPEMAPTTFVRWSMNGSEGRPSWKSALQRLGAAANPS